MGKSAFGYNIYSSGEQRLQRVRDTREPEETEGLTVGGINHNIHITAGDRLIAGHRPKQGEASGAQRRQLFAVASQDIDNL